MVTYIKSDLEFILAQIKIAEAHADGQPLYGPGGLIPSYNVAWGLRTVDGSNNHLLPGQEQWGAADQQFPHLLDPVYRPADGTEFDPDGPGPAPAVPTAPNYNLSNNPNSLVFDSSLRTISNLLVDQTLGNPAAVLTALERAGSADPMTDLAAITAIYETFKPAFDAEYDARVVMQNAKALADSLGDGDPGTPPTPEEQAALDVLATAIANHNTAVANLEAARDVRDAALLPFGIGMDGDNVHLPNIAPDEGLSAPFNSWFTLFGQFFDHGLDLVNKGGSGTVFVPLQPDDPLYVEGSNTNFMVLTRATVSAGADGILGDDPGTVGIDESADDVGPVNTTTSFVDQNQTYTSHPSHQVFLRQYVLNADGEPVATGNLIEGANGGMATWAEVKAQASDILGINLTDADVGSVPLLRTDPYGNFIPGPNGFPQLVIGLGADGIPNTADDVVVEGDPTANGGLGVSTAGAIRTSHAFLADIAHEAVPVGKVADGDIEIGLANPGNGDTEYDNELLDAHFVAGDGRVNENIGLTAVHHVFHAEHNRLVEHTKEVVLQTGDLDFLNEWLADDVAELPTTPAEIAALVWDGERLFQAAKFGTEMQYQHLVFEEFARKVQPTINTFLVPDGFDTTMNPSIVAEFAHVVYRFGHSMLTESIDRFDPNFNSDDISLIQGFLNPTAFNGVGGSIEDGVAAGAIIRGMTRQAGNQIDEFVTSALRNNLLGLPLDLATINLARGRDTGVPSLNAARAEFYEMTDQNILLKPYESWTDFAGHLKHEASIINFIASYGTHSLITSQTTIEGKRDAAMTLVFGQSFGGLEVQADAVDFLNATGAYAGGSLGGLNHVDLWIGGLAEETMPFGGMLGSTFNFVFEVQMELLQSGDRFYYLQRLDGLHLFGEMENNSFAAMIMRNSNATHLPSDVFSTPGFILEVDKTKQFNPDTGVFLPGPDGVLGDDPTTVGVDESLDDVVDTNADPAGGGILTPLVIRDNPSTPGPDTNYLRYTGDDHVVLGGTNPGNASNPSGNDILVAGIGDDTLYGDGGNDRLDGHFGNDIINGGDGDDIIVDSGGDDNIKAGAGNDVVHAGPGLDLVMGGPGQDFIFLGTDEGSEVFAGEGNDFIYGNKNAERILGNEGDDWIETGTFDGAPGDNFDEIFARDEIAGHDVFLGDGGFDEFIAEGGDDIMVGSAGRGKMVGMSGFDWTTYKDNAAGVNADIGIPIIFDESPVFPPNAALDEYESVEGLSGTRFNDTLTGTDENATTLLPIAQGGTGGGYAGSVLNAAGIARIAGLQAVVGAGVTSFGSGDIILGGDGNDTITGKGGDDIIDGDKWLDVQIGVFALADVNHTGPALELHNSMTTLAARMFSGELNPGQLSIVRTIRSDTTAGDIDTAKFRGALSEYAFAGNADGSIQVTHVIEDAIDGSDKLWNIERVEFADATLSVIVGTNAGETLNGTAGPDLIFGLGGNDILNGLAGNDILVGGAGNDTLNGGADNDTYMFGLTDGSDTINETAGIDRIVVATGAAALTALNSFEVTFGAGNDNLVITVNGLTVTVVDHFVGANGGPAPQSVEFINFNGATFNGYLLDGDYAISTDDFGDRTATVPLQNTVLVGTTGDDTLIGSTGNDILFGHDDDDDLNGGDGDDLLVGGAGSDELDGGLDADTMVGGTSSDTYLLDDLADVVVEVAGGGTGDTIETELTAFSLELIAEVENLFYTGADAGPFVGTGNALNNVISGGDLDDTLSGLLGSDTLIGGLGDDTLSGGDGNDTLDGEAGEDTMAGGAGNDVYFVDNGDDVVDESAAGSTGIDRVESTISYALGAGVENLDLNGGDPINGVGNELANVINGNGDGNELFGSGGNDTLNGNDGDDLLDGGVGDDILNGGDDSDTINGGAGNDTIDVGTDLNAIVYNAPNFGNDVINSFDANPAGGQDTINLSALGVTLANFAARVTIVDVEDGAVDDTLVTVRDASSVVIGTIRIEEVDGNDVTAADFTLSTTPVLLPGATAGNNVLNGTGGNDEINALAGNDTVNANAGNDTVIGGAGNDSLNGGLGDDVFIWNANAVAPTDGRDLVDGGSEGVVGDILIINGNASSETFRIYSRQAFDDVLGNSLAGINAATEIIITRNGTNAASIIAELIQIEEIRINGIDPAGTSGSAGAGDTFQIIGDFFGTNLSPNTITITGDAGNDTIDLSGMTSNHHVVFNSNGGNDLVVDPGVAANVEENASTATTVYTALTNGLAGNDGTVAYSLSGADAALFSIDATNGAVSFLASPDFENPTDANGDNVYSVVVHATGSSVETTKEVAITVSDVAGATINGTKRNDRIDGSSLQATTGEGDTISGGKGKDKISALAGNDTVFAGAGNDKLDGGADDDFLAGGSGKDTFIFAAGYGNDTVSDYKAGQDKFNLSGTGVGGYAALKTLMTEAEGSVVIAFSNSDTLKILDTTIKQLHKSDFDFA